MKIYLVIFSLGLLICNKTHAAERKTTTNCIKKTSCFAGLCSSASARQNETAKEMDFETAYNNYNEVENGIGAVYVVPFPEPTSNTHALIVPNWQSFITTLMEKGQEYKALAVAKNLLDVLNIKTIAKTTGLTIEQVQELKNNKEKQSTLTMPLFAKSFAILTMNKKFAVSLDRKKNR